MNVHAPGARWLVPGLARGLARWCTHVPGLAARRVALAGAAGALLAGAFSSSASGTGSPAVHAVTAASVSAIAYAPFGPPMVCHEVMIGKAKSLPWDGGRGGSASGYDVLKLPGDTAALLAAESSTLVRMETLRRAAVYISYQTPAEGERLAWELIGRRGGWVMLGEASGKLDPASWFDVAYFIGCLNQVGMGSAPKFGEAKGVPGYMIMEKALKLAKEIGAGPREMAEMQFGAAVMTHPAMRNMEWNYDIGTRDDIYDRHILAAVRACEGNELLETNIAAHLKNFTASIEQVRRVAAGKK